MTRERYEYLTNLRGTGELENDPKLFKELFEFERKAARIVQYYAIDNTDTIEEARKLMPQFDYNAAIEIALDNQDIKPSKAAREYLKSHGSIY